MNFWMLLDIKNLEKQLRTAVRRDIISLLTAVLFFLFLLFLKYLFWVYGNAAIQVSN